MQDKKTVKTRTMAIEVVLPFPEEMAQVADRLAAQQGVPVEKVLTALGARHLQVLLDLMCGELAAWNATGN